MHWNKFIYNNTNRRTNCPNLFCQETLHVSGSSSAHHQEFSTVHSALVYVMQVWWQLETVHIFGVSHGVLSLRNCSESLSAKSCTVLFLRATHESLFCRHRWEDSVTMGRANTDSTANYKLKYQLAKTKEKRLLLGHVDYSGIVNYRKNILVIFPGIFGILHGILKILCIYSASSRRNPADDLRNNSWETLDLRELDEKIILGTEGRQLLIPAMSGNYFCGRMHLTFSTVCRTPPQREFKLLNHSGNCTYHILQHLNPYILPTHTALHFFTSFISFWQWEVIITLHRLNRPLFRMEKQCI